MSKLCVYVCFVALTLATARLGRDTPRRMDGGDSDPHGCKSSAGYDWCENRGECIRRWEFGLLSETDFAEACSSLPLGPDPVFIPGVTFEPLGPGSALIPDLPTVCLHKEDAEDHKCTEACADRAFQMNGVAVNGTCPEIYNTVDRTVKERQCIDGTTQLHYCPHASLFVTITTKGEGGVEVAFTGVDAADPIPINFVRTSPPPSGSRTSFNATSVPANGTVSIHGRTTGGWDFCGIGTAGTGPYFVASGATVECLKGCSGDEEAVVFSVRHDGISPQVQLKYNTRAD